MTNLIAVMVVMDCVVSVILAYLGSRLLELTKLQLVACIIAYWVGGWTFSYYVRYRRNQRGPKA